MRHTLYKYSTRLLAVLLTLTLLLAVIPAASAEGESGTCGAGLTWTLSAGTLTITGSGDMEDFPESTMAPWYPLRDQILRLELPEGLTSIGMLAFYGCENLTSVTIPASVKTIGSYAFANCTGLGMLTIGSGVTRINECAFSDCYALAALRLPQGLQIIGKKAFYRCESITTVDIPSSVTSIGMSAFAYCKDLVTANVQAQITLIPEWLFYGCEKLVTVTLPDSAEGISEYAFRGCESLNTVYYGGTAQTPEQIQQTVGGDVPSFGGTGFVTDGQPGNTNTGASTTENGDGTVTQENTTVTTGTNSTVSVTVQNTRPQDSQGGQFNADITVTVDGEDGWDDAQEAVEEGLGNYSDSVTTAGGENQGSHVTVYVNGTDTVDPDFVNTIAGRDTTMTIITQNGSVWEINGNDLVVDAEGAYTLTYQLTMGSPELCEELGVTTCYVLRFLAPAQVNARVEIRLGGTMALQTATLLQRNKEVEQIQSVVVDQQGSAGFYLASVTDETEYYIAMNLPNLEQEPYVPDSLLPNSENQELYRTIEYEITGRESSWGMNIGQVTWILAAVMVGSIVIVGFVIFLLNKRKLKRGYVPNMDDYEEF